MRKQLLLILLLGLATLARAGEEPYRVLVLYSIRSSLPINLDWFRGLTQGLQSVPGMDVWLDNESLNLERVKNQTDMQKYLKDIRGIFKQKYGYPSPNLIIPVYTPALDFLLKNDQELFPGVPILFLGANKLAIANRQLPPHVTGVTTYADTAATLQLALQVHPGTQRVALIVGAGLIDQVIERNARQELQPFETKVEFIWLKGMLMDELTEAVSRLPPHTIILYLAQMQDRNGKDYEPASDLKVLSEVANAPIYALWDTLLDYGAVGGRMVPVEEDGFLAGKIGQRILLGESPANIPILMRKTNPVIFNGRELARWGINEDLLPAESRIRNSQPSTWDQYQLEIMIAAVIMLVQGAMIALLLLHRRHLRQAHSALQFEHDLRDQAEAMAAGLRVRLARFSKERTLGSMTTTIAHEIGQPLTAILNYTQAVRQRLQGGIDDIPRLFNLLDKIEGQAQRAGAIPHQVRSMVNNSAPSLIHIALPPMIDQVIRMIEQESEGHCCHIVRKIRGDLPAVYIDPLQIQLVLVNLLNNAMHSLAASKRGNRRIVIDARSSGDEEIQVSVTDGGGGIAPEQAEKIFETYYSGTNTGMGVGLAICRDIISAHGGRIWYEPNPAGGAIFRFTIRTVGV